MAIDVPPGPAYALPVATPGTGLQGDQNAAPVLAELAREFYAHIIPVVMELYGQRLSLRAIARELEAVGSSQGTATRPGGAPPRCSGSWLEDWRPLKPRLNL